MGGGRTRRSSGSAKPDPPVGGNISTHVGKQCKTSESQSKHTEMMESMKSETRNKFHGNLLSCFAFCNTKLLATAAKKSISSCSKRIVVYLKTALPEAKTTRVVKNKEDNGKHKEIYAQNFTLFMSILIGLFCFWSSLFRVSELRPANLSELLIPLFLLDIPIPTRTCNASISP